MNYERNKVDINHSDTVRGFQHEVEHATHDVEQRNNQLDYLNLVIIF